MESDNMTDIVAAAKAHLASLPSHLKDRYSANIIAKLVTELTVQRACTSAARLEAIDSLKEMQELRKLDGEALGQSLEEYHKMKELCVNGEYLTEEEREAVEWSIKVADDYARVGHRQAKEVSSTLRKLLERLK